MRVDFQKIDGSVSWFYPSGRINPGADSEHDIVYRNFFIDTGNFNDCLQCNIPALTVVDNNVETRSSTFFIEDGSYVKLKTLTRRAISKNL